jgi:hypothetical protein
MGHKRTWYATTVGEVWHAIRHRYEGNVTTGMRRSVFLPVTLGEGVPAKDVGRTVMVRMPATVAADLGYRMIREAREARRSDVREGLATDLLSLSRDSERVIERTRDYLRENN